MYIRKYIHLLSHCLESQRCFQATGSCSWIASGLCNILSPLPAMSQTPPLFPLLCDRRKAVGRAQIGVCRGVCPSILLPTTPPIQHPTSPASEQDWHTRRKPGRVGGGRRMKTFGIGGDGQREGGSPPASLGTHPYLLLGFGKPQGFEFPAQLPGGKAPSTPCKPHKRDVVNPIPSSSRCSRGGELEELVEEIRNGLLKRSTHPLLA